MPGIFCCAGSGLVPQSIRLGDQFMCALLAGRSVKCWGAGSRLGDEANVNRGDLRGQMGDAMPTVALGAGRSAVSLSVGADTCAILDDGALKCLGLQRLRPLGDGDTVLVGDQPQQMGDGLSSTALGFCEGVRRAPNAGSHRAHQTAGQKRHTRSAAGWRDPLLGARKDG